MNLRKKKKNTAEHEKKINMIRDLKKIMNIHMIAASDEVIANVTGTFCFL